MILLEDIAVLGSITLVLARFAVICWMLVVGFVALASLLSDPSPFVLIAFALAASLPFIFRRYHPALLSGIVLIAAGIVVISSVQ